MSHVEIEVICNAAVWMDEVFDVVGFTVDNVFILRPRDDAGWLMVRYSEADRTERGWLLKGEVSLVSGVRSAADELERRHPFASR